MLQAMAAIIEAIYVVFGDDSPVRRSALSMDNYYEATCSYEKIQLGNLINTRKMTVGLPSDKQKKIWLMLTHWHKKRRKFTIRQIAELLGVLEYAATWSIWLRYIFYSLRFAAIHALRSNKVKVYNNNTMSNFLSDSMLPPITKSNILRKTLLKVK